MATKVDTQKLYAMKVITKQNLVLRGSTSVNQAIAEKEVLQQLAVAPHPYIVSLRYAFQDNDNLYLLMDFVGGGDLFTLLESKGSLSESGAVIYTAGVDRRRRGSRRRGRPSCPRAR